MWAAKGLSHSYACIHVSILPQTPLPSRLPHNPGQSSLCYPVGPCGLSILKYNHMYLLIANSAAISSAWGFWVRIAGVEVVKFGYSSDMFWGKKKQSFDLRLTNVYDSFWNEKDLEGMGCSVREWAGWWGKKTVLHMLNLRWLLSIQVDLLK